MLYPNLRRVEGGLLLPSDELDLPALMREASLHSAMGELEAARDDLPPAIVERLVALADSLRAMEGFGTIKRPR
jgi:hypothetical protein